MTSPHDLKNAGLKATVPRLKIINLFEASKVRHLTAEDVYRQRTATPGTVRTRDEVRRFFDGVELVDPGVTWADQWRPENDPTSAAPVTAEGSGIWAGVGRKP